MAGYLSSLVWLIVRIIVFLVALGNIDRGIKYLKNFAAPTLPPAAAMTGIHKAASPNSVNTLKSDNYVPSTVEEQRILMQFEEELCSIGGGKKGEVPVETARWNGAIYPSGTGLSDSVFYDASRMILCSNGMHPSMCADIKILTKDSSLLGLKTSNRIIFGIKMVLESTPCSAARFRIKLYDHFKKTIWPAIRSKIDFKNEEREIIFVGYHSGASLASLSAWHTIKLFEQLKPTGLIINNGNNQVKVITWDELPMFTLRTASKSPILPCNHSKFTSISIPESNYRTISCASSGLDEIYHFASSGDEIALKQSDYSDFASRISSKKASTENSMTTATAHLPLFIKQKNLKSIGEDRITKLTSILALHYTHLSILYELMSKNYRSYLVETILMEPNACAVALADRLSNTIFPGSIITCRIDGFDQSKGTFQIFCSYKMAANLPAAQFLSFDAILGDESAHQTGKDILAFMKEIQVEKSSLDEKKGEEEGVAAPSSSKKSKSKKMSTKTEIIKALKYSGPEPVTDNWANCLFELFEQRPHMSLISPFAIQKGSIFPRVSYIPFLSNHFTSGAGKNTGCYLRSPSVSHELLQVYKADPTFFYRAVDTGLMKFPSRCKKLLFHIPFKASDRPGLEALQQLSVEYLTQLVSMNPIADSEVTLWRPRDTESFKTLNYFGSDYISARDLSDRDNYEEDFENSIIKCLSNPSYPYRDCTNPQNRWVPMACPSACEQTHGDIDFLCKQVKSCPSSGYYIATSTEGTVEKLSDIHSVLIKRPNPQFGIFHVQAPGRNSFSYFSNNFNLALFRMPLNQKQ